MNNIQKTLIIGLVVMVLLNLCTLGYILFKPHKGGRCGKGGFGREGRHSERIFNELGLNTQQREKIDHLKVSFDYQMDAIKNNADSIRKLQIEQFQNDKVDYTTARKNSALIGKYFKQMDQLRFKHFDEVRKILTPEQRTKFFEQMKNFGPMGRRHSSCGPEGRRGCSTKGFHGNGGMPEHCAPKDDMPIHGP